MRLAFLLLLSLGITSCVEFFESSENEVDQDNLFFDSEVCGDFKKVNIIGGTAATNNAWDSVVSIFLDFDQVPFCSGVLIHPRVVLTAAHCFVTDKFDLRKTQFPTAAFKVRVGPGQDCFKSRDNLKNIDSIQVHPAYEYKDSSNLRAGFDYDNRDMAFIVLSSELSMDKLVQPLTDPLELKSFFAGEFNKLTVIGFGQRGSDNDAVAGSRFKFNASYAGDYSHEFWFNGVNGIGSCRGDSGGAILSKIKSQKGEFWRSHGILSRGPSDCGSGGMEYGGFIHEALCWTQKSLIKQGRDIKISDSNFHCLREDLVQRVCQGQDMLTCHGNVSKLSYINPKIVACSLIKDETEFQSCYLKYQN